MNAQKTIKCPVTNKPKKICSRCKRVKPVNMFYKRKDTATGYTHSCKKCQGSKKFNLDSMPIKVNDKLQVLLSIDGNDAKECTVCKEVKPLTKFYRRISSSTGRESSCMDCKKAREKQKRKERIRFGKRYY